MIIISVGVFITVEIIIVTPIALLVAKNGELNRVSILLAMIG